MTTTSEGIQPQEPKPELNGVKEIFSQIGIKVDFRRTLSNCFEVVVNDRPTSQFLDLRHRQGLDALMGDVLGAISKWIYAELKKYAQDQERFVHECYYNAGDLGAFIHSDIPEVKMGAGRFPAWFNQALRRYQGDSWWAGLPFRVDHTFISKDGSFVSEPYSMHMHDFEDMIKFCRWANFEFYVTGESRHFPGHTFRVVIRPARG